MEGRPREQSFRKKSAKKRSRSEAWGSSPGCAPQGAEGGQENRDVPRGAEGGYDPCPVPQSSKKGKSRCPVRGCASEGVKIRVHVYDKHLPPVFRVSVPSVDRVRALRLEALLWLAEACVGERKLWALCSALDFESIFGPSFTGWDESLLTEMVAFCHFCEEDIPRDLEVGGRVHPTML
jgi:hypothetical protein